MKKKVVNYRPEYRILARWFDLITFQFVVLVLLSISEALLDTNIVHFIVDNDYEIMYRYNLLILYLYVFAEAWMLSTWGTTPGKWIFKIKLLTEEGVKLSYWTALIRSHYVWLVGLGAGVLYIITIPLSYFRLEKNGITDWDKTLKLVIKIQTVSVWRPVLILAFLSLSLYNIIITGLGLILVGIIIIFGFFGI